MSSPSRHHAAEPAPAAAEHSTSCDPSTNTVFAEHEFVTDQQIDRLLGEAEAGQTVWAQWAPARRAEVLRRMAQILRADLPGLAEQATREMGKPIAQARAEIEKCAALCDWYAAHGAAMIADEATTVDGNAAYVSYLPLGTVFAVMPWNFPYWQAMRGAVPILFGGNGFLLKPASNVVGCAGLLGAAWQRAGLPPGVFTVANLVRDQAPRVIADRRIAAVTVTGGVAAGRLIASLAARALKKSVLELGGSDPFIVLADTDLDACVKAAVTARFQNGGQVCIAAKRFIVEQPILAAFTERFVAATEALVVGDPLREETYVGPMARADLLDELHAQVTATLAAGARLLTGGARLPRPGNFYPPTVLADVLPGMAAFDTETFGPVAPIIAARDADHAIDLANNSEFGLSGSLWSADHDRARRLARRMDTGGVFINGFSVSDPRVPIGGIKHSGYGRELSHFGLREFMNAQTVWVDRCVA